MKIILIYIIAFTVIAATFYSCAGFQVSTSVGYGVSGGPYGFGGYGGYGGYGNFGYPRVNTGIYHGGYRGVYGR